MLNKEDSDENECGVTEEVSTLENSVLHDECVDVSITDNGSTILPINSYKKR